MVLLLSCIHHPRISHSHFFFFFFFLVSLSRSAQNRTRIFIFGIWKSSCGGKEDSISLADLFDVCRCADLGSKSHISPLVLKTMLSWLTPLQKPRSISRRDDFFAWLLTRAEIVQYAVYPIASRIQHVQTFCLRGLLPFCSVQPAPFVFVRAQILLHLIAS